MAVRTRKRRKRPYRPRGPGAGRPLEGASAKKPFAFRLPGELIEQLDDRADRFRISRSKITELGLMYYLASCSGLPEFEPRPKQEEPDERQIDLFA